MPKGKRKFSRIPSEQWKLPAGFSADGKKMVPLLDVLSPDKPTLETPQLTQEQRAELTTARIRRQRRYKMGMVGAGLIDKKRALAEVKAQSEVGRTLTEIELRTIEMLKEMAAGK